MLMNDILYIDMTLEDQENMSGGFLMTFLAIGGIAAAGVAIYEAGKATGEFIAECIK